ncbi:MAG: seg [Patescibacteria group bacterium]|nr:seg [Patescibacteria group bacterium]
MSSINDTSKRHIGSVNDTNDKSVNTIGIFQNPMEKAFYACAQKIEKIVSAVYLVTDVMEPDLPLTRTLRDRAIGILSACYGLLDGELHARNVAIAIVKIEEVMSLVGVGRIAHHISEMNANVIEQELSKVRNVLTGEHAILVEKYASYQKNDQTVQPQISRNVFSDGLFDQVSRERELIHNVGRSRSESSLRMLPQIKTTFINDTEENVVYKNDIGNQEQKIKTTFKTTPQKITVPDRKYEIIEAIKKNGNTTINDIKLSVPGMSDKTLQRHLAKLIELGLIVREGNKRWTTYSIPKT